MGKSVIICSLLHFVTPYHTSLGMGEMYYVRYIIFLYLDVMKNCKSDLYSPALEKYYDMCIPHKSCIFNLSIVSTEEVISVHYDGSYNYHTALLQIYGSN